MLLSKHATRDGVSARGLLDEGESESPCQSGDIRETGGTDKQNRKETRKKRGKRSKRRESGLCLVALVRGARSTQPRVERHLATGDVVTE